MARSTVLVGLAAAGALAGLAIATLTQPEPGETQRERSTQDTKIRPPPLPPEEIYIEPDKKGIVIRDFPTASKRLADPSGLGSVTWIFEQWSNPSLLAMEITVNNGHSIEAKKFSVHVWEAPGIWRLQGMWGGAIDFVGEVRVSLQSVLVAKKIGGVRIDALNGITNAPLGITAFYGQVI
jgi:hypothetical protein